MSRKCKTVEASLRVLETLKLLVQEDASIDEIIKHLSDNCKAIYTPEVILKYLNTLRVAGFKIEKIGSKYSLGNHPCIINLNEQDLHSINLLETFSKILPEKAPRKEFSEFIELLKHRILEGCEVEYPLELFKNIKIENPLKIEQLEQCCVEKLKLKITYSKDAEVLQAIFEPKEIVYNESEAFLEVYDGLKARIQRIPVGCILEFSQLPLRSNEKMMPETTTFKLKSSLANNYKMRPFERLTKKEDNGDLIITNSHEDKGELLKRLFKYGHNCEVISPKVFRAEYIKMLDKMIDEYS